MQIIASGLGRLGSVCVAILMAGRAWAGVELENSNYRVSVDAGQGTFTARVLPSGKEFLTEGKLTGQGGIVTKFEATEKGFGTGQSLEIKYANGNRDYIALYPNWPFIFFRTMLHNPVDDEWLVLNHVSGISAGH